MKLTYKCKKCGRFYNEEMICPYCLDTITLLCGSITVDFEEAREFIKWAKDKAFCNSGQHICDRLANQFEQTIKKIESENEKLVF